MDFKEFEIIANESVEGLNHYASSYDNEDSFNVRDGAIVQMHVSGGAQGGNCWGNEAQYFTNSSSAQEFLPLDKILTQVNPQISYLQYREIQKLIVEGSKHESEYYGNHTDYTTYTLDIRKLYDALFPDERNE